jgi:hypothetical protein
MCPTSRRAASWMNAAACLAGALLLCVAFGCGSDGMVVASGSVTFDGRSLVDGAISFYPADKSVAPQGGRIRGGQFEVRCRPGKYRVEILASRPKEGAKEASPGMTPLEQFIPARYNDASSLEAEVSTKSRQQFTFDLISGTGSK